MPYDVNKLTTVAQLQTLAARVKTEIGNAIDALPTEMFLDQAHTAFVPNFTFAQATYTGATDPNLNGKPVLVLAVKGIENDGTESITYSFLDVSTLVDTYTVKTGDSTKVLNIAGYEVEFKISASAGNIITPNADGLYVTNRVSGAANGNITSFDANGAPVDSGIASANVLQVSNIALDAEVAEMITEVFA